MLGYFFLFYLQLKQLNRAVQQNFRFTGFHRFSRFAPVRAGLIACAV
jgi:hypothetical protein